MKKYICLFLGLLIYSSCDIEEGPYGILAQDCAGVVGGENICGCTDSTAFNYDVNATFEDSSCVYDSSQISFVQNVLIEDYTGHTCPNCPEAARELQAIHDIYGDQIIGMAIHVSKSFARPYHISQAPQFQYDFRTQWGDAWDDFFGISLAGLPRGMINRVGVQNQSLK